MIQIPEPQLKVVVNRTPFPHFECQKMGKGRVYYDTVAIKGTFDLRAGSLPLSDEQAEVVLCDEYHDEEDAARSSIARPGDLVVGKPSTDVVVTGRARSPGRVPLPRWECNVSVLRSGTTLLDATVVATGPRRWTHRALRGFRLSDPEPTTEVPIRYELAYGGWYELPGAPGDEPRVHVYKPNPSGTGVFDEAKLDRARPYDGPQWELRSSPVTSINEDSPLAGLGPVARMWQSRLAFAGTYDEAWDRQMREDVAHDLPADYPADFDPRFFQCAHPSLVAPAPLRAGDVVRLTGLTVEGELGFELPRLRPSAQVLAAPASEWVAEPLLLDLVHIDLDAARVHLCWRMALAEEREIIAAFITTEES